MNKTGESANRKNGEIKQHKQDRKRAIVAIFFAPIRLESIPLTTQARAPDPMIRNEYKETFRFTAGYCLL